MRAGREAEAGRGAGRAELGQVRDAELGRAGEKWCARGLKGGVRAGPKWARAERERAWARAGLGREVGCGLGFGFCFGFFLSISIYSLISNLSQTKVEFKYEFEFKPQSIKSMHQHECNIRSLKL